jgi:hypothetical protein
MAGIETRDSDAGWAVGFKRIVRERCDLQACDRRAQQAPAVGHPGVNVEYRASDSADKNALPQQ